MTQNEQKLRDYLKRVTADLHQTRQRLGQAEDRPHEPIAVVGMACRFPGGVTSPEDLWRLLEGGGDAITPFPADRGWDLDRLYDPDARHTGTFYARGGGFLHDAAEFDPAFFGISPREAVAMDPQQRQLLEVSWEAVERAGLDPVALRGSRTGVFAGVMYQDYAARLGAVPDDVEGYLSSGNAYSVTSGRIAYTLGLEGPVLTVDTACSSSLVALHLAVQSLRHGEGDLALAGGVTVMSTPDTYIDFSRQRGLAPDGRCKSFSDDADGTGFSEGVGMIVLERLSDARRNGHQVLAVIRGSAVNSDGASSGLTAPNGPSQQRVIRAALANARLSADQIDVVEAHGTGTTLGDPIEAQALLATYGQDRPADRPLWLGSLKSNLGHTQGAAGVGGVIKMVLAMRHGLMPRTLHVGTPSQKIDWSAGAVSLLTEAREWTGEARRSAVSSFGISGTNAHVILEQAPEIEAVPANSPDVVPWVFSARDGEGLRSLAGRLAEFADESEVDVAEVARALAGSRASLPHRAAVVGSTREDFAAGLRSLADGGPGVTGVARGARPVFVFPGYGAQWLGMGVELLDASPVFAERLMECDQELRRWVDWSLLDVLRGIDGAPSVERADVVQPALFAVMVSLAAVWRSYGVTPAAVTGHSLGEVAAACVAGALSLPDAVKVVALRSRVLMSLAGTGTMASIPLTVDQVRARLAGTEGIGIGAVNSPLSTVVTGDTAAVTGFVAACTAEGIPARLVPIDYASHSAHVEAVRGEFAPMLDGIEPRDGEIPMFSTARAEVVPGSALTGDYWFESLRGVVRLADSVTALAGDGFGPFIEVGPHPVLTVPIQECLEAAGSDAAVVPTVTRKSADVPTFLKSLSRAYTAGVTPDWTVLLGEGPVESGLPTYPFAHERYWLDATTAFAPGEDTDSKLFWEYVERHDIEALVDTLDVGTETGRTSLGTLLPALSEWRRKSRLDSTVDSWRYRITWKPVQGGGTAQLTGTWLVVTPDGEPGDWTAEVPRALVAHGAEAVVLGVDPAIAGRDTWTRLITDALEDHPEIQGVVSLLAFDERPHPDHPAVGAAVIGTAVLTQALGDAAVRAPLWIATRHAVSVGRADLPAAPWQAQVGGLGRVIGLEHPERWGGLVDLPEAADEKTAERLIAVLAGLGDEDQLAVRPAGILVRRLIRAEAGQPARTRWTPRGTILITGGTGSLGKHVARRLARDGAEHLVLTSRRGPESAGAAELVAELGELGARATVVACDAADRDALTDVFAGLGDESLTAVVHAAGVGDLAYLADTGADEIAAVVTGKVAGAVNLDELLGDTPLDAFVLFSSNAAVWGAAGQGAYAAGNAFLDALAEQRRARGRAATSIAWGVWGGGSGMMRAGEEDFVVRRGMRLMDPETAVSALMRSVELDDTFVSVADMDWSRFLPGFRAARPRPLFDDLPEARELLAADAVEAAEVVGGLAATLSTVAEADRLSVVQELVREVAAAVLGHSGAGRIDPDTAFRDLGFDSLTALELRNQLAAATGVKLPATLVFDHPSTTAVARLLLAETVGADVPAAVVTTTAAANDEPIAIVSVNCRFGGARTPEDLWRVLAEGLDTITEFPADRGWDVAGIYDPEPGKPGKTYTTEGGLLAGAGDFDPTFFGISPREALVMDPQQRIVLEAAWETFERAGIDPVSLRGSKTGVFVGASAQEYGVDAREAPEGTEGYFLAGSQTSVVSGRVSYVLGLEGPAITVDTACSSALVAVHLACQSLRKGESSLALAGGVAVLATPGAFLEFGRQRGLAPDGRCKPFAEAADGTGWGEGVGVVLLERLSDAKANGHQVLALVRGSAVNSDGASNGLTAPNGPSQERVIRQALADAGMTTADVDVVEAHGTGTRLGDPIEARALLATYGQDREAPLLLGSVKSNFGHTQAAAGAAGIIKMVLAMRHGVVPKTLHVDKPSSHVDWTKGSVALVTEPTPWPSVDRPWRAGVSSFGISGTNAHVIIEQAEPEESTSDTAVVSTDVVPWVLSAKSEAALRDQAVRLKSVADLDPVDVGLSLALSRSRFEYRAVLTGDLTRGLAALAAGEPDPAVSRGSAATGKLAVVFTGQGAQRLGMGRELYEAFPVFRDAFDAVCLELDRQLPEPIQRVVFEQADLLDRTLFTQAGLFAVETALFRLAESWGLKPDFVAGHSIGELAAAHVAGVLSLPDAATLVAARGRLMQALPTGGAMLAVEATEAEVVANLVSGVDIAAVNGPASVVVSGDEAGIAELERVFAGRRVKRLQVSHAFHSHLMEPMLAEFHAVAKSLEFHAPKIPVVSTGDVRDPEYWVSHVRQAVRFADGVAAMVADGVTTVIELGPGGVLSGMGQSCTEDAVFLPALRPGRSEVQTFTQALGEAHVRGTRLDWTGVFAGRGGRRIDLPTYAFQHERYWLEPAPSTGEPGTLGQIATGHPLAGAAVELPDDGNTVLTGRISSRTQRWVADHRVRGEVLLPGTAFVDLVIAAGDQAGSSVIDELTLENPLVVHEDDADLRVTVAPADRQDRRAFTVHSRTEGGAWLRHAAGFLATAGAASANFGLTEWPPPGAQALDVESRYAELEEAGFGYGPAFRGLRSAWRAGTDVFAEVALPEGSTVDTFGLHPALLDAALHAIGMGEPVEDGQRAKIPFAWTGVRLFASGASALRVRIRPAAHGAVTIQVADPAGAPVASVDSLIFREVSQDDRGVARPHKNLFHLDWVPASTGTAETDVAVIGSVTLALGGIVAESLEALPGDVPDLVFFPLPEGTSLDGGRAVHASVHSALTAARSWLAETRFQHAKLVFVTRNATAVRPGEDVTDLVNAAVWGLVRSAQAENPGRFVLVDVDEWTSTPTAWPADETELAVRDGEILVPRLVRTEVPSNGAAELNPEGTVLITGGTGTLGGLVARHLVADHRVRRLVLTSRGGRSSLGAVELEAELIAHGVEVKIETCDVGDREALRRVLDAIPAEHPLTAVVHTAGVIDDGILESLTAERVSPVLRPKVDATVHLHELTEDADLAAFVVFSSAAGVLGNAGQAGYAAANAFMDALVQHRRAAGLPGVSLAWGPWARESAITGGLAGTDVARMSRGGISPLATEDGLALFDVAGASAHAVVLPMRFDPASAPMTPLLRNLVRGPARRTAAGAQAGDQAASLLAELTPLAADRRRATLLDLVRVNAATVLGFTGTEVVGAQRPFKDLGFDSLTAVELRNQLTAVTGLRLPATLVFDYPTPADVVTQLLTELFGAEAETTAEPVTRAEIDEPIAIVAMSCRYPGGVASPEDFWRLLADGGDGITPFPTDRGWSLDTLVDDDPDHAGTTYAREGGFLHDAAEFDAGFFGISPREALAMDPQQRLLLEASWEVLERAGIDPVSLRGSKTGVFTGLMYHNYAARLLSVPAELEGFVGNGSASSVASGRVSYTLGLEGPAVTVDTACSSSLVALHWAVQALRRGEATLALAGGVTVMPTADTFVGFSRQRGLAADGRCKSFADAADGTGWSEGIGLLLLERLSDARANGHQVLAVVRGSAVNSDGASNGLTAPNGPSQQRVIRQALADAGMTTTDVDVVEAHGTGTRLGDPIEAQALLATYGRDRAGDQPLLLGSVKSNIGHTQAAAGVAGIIKMVLAMHHGVLPKTLHVDKPSSHVDWSDGAVELLTEERVWPSVDRPRRAAVSSFGISGTNAHVILEQAGPEVSTSDSPVVATDVVPWVLSAKSESALRAQAGKLAGVTASPVDVGRSLALSRSRFEYRAVLAGSATELTRGLAALADGSPDPVVVEGQASEGKLAVVFTGQGAQHAGMGRELYETFPVFRAALDAVGEELDRYLPEPIRQVVFERPELLDRTMYTQAGLFAVEVALFRLAESWGLAPDLVGGHSIGELAAAHVAGVLSLPDAAKLVAARGRLMQALPSGGAMLAIEATEAEVVEALVAGVDIAAVNGPASVVVSGDEDAVAVVEKAFEGRRVKRLQVSHAFHSHRMEPMLAEFRAVAGEVTFSEPEIPVVSNLTGKVVAGELCDPEYWVSHVRQAVRFADGVAVLETEGVTTVVELGPGGVLSGMGRACTDRIAFLPALRTNRGEAASYTLALGEAHVRGAGLDWAGVFAGRGGTRVDLPTYPFQREHYWLDEGIAPGAARDLGLGVAEHPLTGAVVELPESGGVVLTGRISVRTHPWLAEHRVLGSVLVPGTAFVDLAVAAGDQLGCDLVEELTIEAPLVLPDDEGVLLRVEAGADRRISVHSRREGGTWLRHATGSLALGQVRPGDVTAWPPPDAEPVDVSELYPGLAEAGLDYGPVFAGLSAAWLRGDQVFAEVSLPKDVDGAGFGVHPALLDAALHALAFSGAIGDDGRTRLPFAWTDVQLYASGATALRVTVTPAGTDSVSLALTDLTGAPVASVGQVALRPVSSVDISSAGAASDSLYRVDWEPAELPSGTPMPVEVWEAPAESMATVLARLQDHVKDEDAAPLAVVIHADAELAAAAVRGLVRSAQSENPGRFVLVDSDIDVPEDLVWRAIAAGEPELMVRGGQVLVPRLVRHRAVVTGEYPISAGDTVLITGGTGALGTAVARHLAAEHGIRNLVLLSRSGSAAPGAAELETALTDLGATVDFVACDAADREALARALDGRRVDAVVHTAGVLDDGVLGSLTPDRIDRVFAPKALAALNLHELLGDVAVFAMFSSIAGVFGSPGQGNYAAANTFLDALAEHRWSNGQHTVSLAWGPWAEVGMAAEEGITGLSTVEALALFDLAIGQPEPQVVAHRLDFGGGTVPALLRKVVPAGRRRAAAPEESAAERLAGLSEEDRQTALLDIVRTGVAAVLGHADPGAVRGTEAFKDLGFDSLTAVELRNRLSAATGVRLPATLIFDHPTPSAIVAHLAAQLGDAAEPLTPVLAELDRLEASLTGLTAGDVLRRAITARLTGVLSKWTAGGPAAEDGAVTREHLETAGADELFAFIDHELGHSTDHKRDNPA
ncbi:type I polyketide synthase [Amycolatopsis sp. NPDC051071]|uniref:type I polyketide synthase n=1 Tax=Amycolatopsis sp. NPDC051071 TaxID=3154637 RepID=UPI003423F3C3